MDSSTRNTIRLWAGLDLLTGALMAFPPVALAFLGLLYSINNMFGSHHQIADFPALGLMLMSMAGALIMVWALARLLQPHRQLAMIDTLARFWVGGLIGWFVLFEGVPPVILIFVITEWAGGIHQGLILLGRRQARQAHNNAKL